MLRLLLPLSVMFVAEARMPPFSEEALLLAHTLRLLIRALLLLPHYLS